MQTVAPKKKMNLPLELQMEDNASLARHYLLVGQGGLFVAPTLVQTVLGSCVSVTMFSPAARWGGIFHALLPRRADFVERAENGDHYRYVDSAIWHLLRQFTKVGIAPASLECKVFGGASPLHRSLLSSAGNRNVETALAVLADAGLTVMAASVGGKDGRKLFFRTDTGLVLQKRFVTTPAQAFAC